MRRDERRKLAAAEARATNDDLVDRDPGPADAIAAVEELIELARQLSGYDYFRSEDPIEAAGCGLRRRVAAVGHAARA